MPTNLPNLLTYFRILMVPAIVAAFYLEGDAAHWTALGIFILAAICGQIRGIPFFWTLIDCSFGIFGIIPLLIVQKQIRKLEAFHSEFKMI